MIFWYKILKLAFKIKLKAPNQNPWSWIQSHLKYDLEDCPWSLSCLYAASEIMLFEILSKPRGRMEKIMEKTILF